MVKNPPVSAGESGSIPGSGGSPGEENGNPLQYSCLKNPMDCRLRILVGNSPQSRKESDTMKQLHFQTHYNWNKVESQGFILIQEIIA